MKILRLSTLVTLLLVFLRTSAQESKVYFKLADSVLMTENSSFRLFTKLDSLRAGFIPSRSRISSYFDRDIDLGYKHQRIDLQLNFQTFLIDLIKKNDTIYAKTIRCYYNLFNLDKSTIEFNSKVDTPQVLAYLNQRNKLYKSKKTILDLTKEIAEYKVFAFYCGDGAPKTIEGKYIEKLVDEENVEELTNMLQSFCVETQAYAVSGFSMLGKNDYPVSPGILKLINYIQKRNSETITCSGCLTGLVEKIYTKKKNANR